LNFARRRSKLLQDATTWKKGNKKTPVMREAMEKIK
jgi:hypothetical protein